MRVSICLQIVDRAVPLTVYAWKFRFPGEVDEPTASEARDALAAVGYYQGGQDFVVDETHGSWGDAEEVPGLAALSQGNTFEINTLSSGSAGNCSAGGSYDTDSSGDGHAFVVDETSGTRRNIQEVPGIAALDQGGSSRINSLSCLSRQLQRWRLLYR